jgi:hypothetical protein
MKLSGGWIQLVSSMYPFEGHNQLVLRTELLNTDSIFKLEWESFFFFK